MTKPLLSIVIPTRNREFYCKEAIHHILSFNDANFELVIYDNSDSEELTKECNSIADDRLRYYKIDGRRNFVLLFDDAISVSQGRYVILIGDDDTVLPNITAIAQWAYENDIPAVTPKLSYGFLWNLNGGVGGKLICHGASDKIKILTAKKQLEILLKNGIIQYDDYDLPRVYHGLMSRDILERIKEKTGHYVGGLSPDLYLSVASCFWVDEYAKVEFPFSLPGACKKSASVGNPRGKFEDMPHLWHRGEYQWNDLIPRYNSAQTIWAETALKAIEENDKDLKFASLFNRNYFLTVFRLQNLDRRKEIDSCLPNYHYLHAYSLFRFLYRSWYKKVVSFKNLLKRERVVYCITGSWDEIVDKLLDSILYKD